MITQANHNLYPKNPFPSSSYIPSQVKLFGRNMKFFLFNGIGFFPVHGRNIKIPCSNVFLKLPQFVTL